MSNTTIVIAALLFAIGVLVFSRSIQSDDGVGVAEGVGFVVTGTGMYVIGSVLV